MSDDLPPELLRELHAATVTGQRAEVVSQAISWLGTPYHHHGRVKGVGVDCAQLLAAVYGAAGVVADLELGSYPREWHLHRDEEAFLAWLQRLGARRVELPAVGDVAVYRYGRCFSHGAIVATPDLRVHSYIGRGVVMNREDEAPLHGRPVQYWTPPFKA